MHDAIDWVRNPDRTPTGFKDSSVFVSAVTAIFEQARTKKRINGSTVRDLLTYLLLRRNPTTGEDVILDHVQPGSEGEVPEGISLLKASVTRSLERYLNHEPSQPYSVLMLLQRMIHNQRQNWANPEEFTLLILSMWLFSRQVESRDISTQRSCLKLHFDCMAYPCRSSEREFMNSDCRYDSWIYNSIDDLCFKCENRISMLRELSYVGSFASLIRASRMVDKDHPLKGILRNEIAWLQAKTTLN